MTGVQTCALPILADGLRFAVDLKNELILGKALNERSLLVADDDGEVDEPGVNGKSGGSRSRSLFGRGGFLLRLQKRREKKTGQKERPKRAEDVHVKLDDIPLEGFQVRLICRTGSFRGVDRTAFGKWKTTMTVRRRGAESVI